MTTLQAWALRHAIPDEAQAALDAERLMSHTLRHHLMSRDAELAATRKQLEEAKAKLAAAEKDVSRVPNGFALAPLTATHEMCSAAHFGPNCAEHDLRSSDREFLEACWTAMLSTAIAAQEKKHE